MVSRFRNDLEKDLKDLERNFDLARIWERVLMTWKRLSMLEGLGEECE